MRILVTGGAGFIGSAFLKRFVPRHPEHEFVNVDKLTYAANLLNLTDIEAAANYQFIRLNLADSRATMDTIKAVRPDWLIHFAAETHVDRSIRGPREFVEANVLGTFNILEAIRLESPRTKLLSISTDEVYGELGEIGAFSESSAYMPNSPYSATKAAADHLCRAYHHTYGLPILITNCSNNFGPRQFPEKLIPLMTLRASRGEPMPVYGEGKNVRDWLYVDDHCDALWQVAERGVLGETYCIGGGYDVPNLEIVEEIRTIVAEHFGGEKAPIQFVPDRPGHDFRYAIDASKIQGELGWRPQHIFADALRETVTWYLTHPDWVRQVESGEYKNWISEHYGEVAR